MSWHVKTFQELSPDKWYEIAKLRSDVFIVEQTSAYHEFDDLDQQSLHLYYEDANKVVSYCRIIPEGYVYNEVTISRVIVKKSHRQMGLGKQLLKRAVEMASAFNLKPIQIQAEQYLTAFYQSFGFEVISEPYLDCDIYHVDMIRRETDVSSQTL
ncbi:ElaA protein [Halolactibacillus halophilus]|uniref:ElaA protein n=1 Tax=Halolactibacillus halophilus TaxID=306540 RepID=A0A1I5T600_9BACI|nr:GNAT family N-acetyltransferase [Halolactibacillus halophilus]GEM02894.1 GNAT family acetyltransferase [Halolactibacillus halophilus]SFP78472.1 ElaA protein [Halolactibacillus halophilus]